MGALHTMRSMNARTDQCTFDIVTAVQGCTDIRAVSWVNIDCVFQTVFFCQLDELAGHQVIVWTTGVFCTDGYIILGAGQIQTNAAHVNGNHFADIGWNIGCAVTNLFKDRDKEFGFVLWFQTFILHHLQNGQQTSNAALVVDETGFEEATFGDNCLWIIADVVAHLDAQIENVLFAVNLFVDAIMLSSSLVLLAASG